MKSMKKTTIIFAMAALSVTSCNLDYAPENTMVDQTVYKNEKTSEAALLGAYVRLNDFLSGAPTDQNNRPAMYYAFQFGDIGTDNLKAQTGSSNSLAIEKSEYTTDQHDGLLGTIYKNGYNAIDYANNVMDGVARYGEFNESTKQQFIAEAKFIRAYTYFQLLLIYGDQALQGHDNGLGLVMRLTPYEGYNPSEAVSRVSNAQVWSQIISDLKDNITYLPEEVPSAALRVRANQTVSKALLSRVYLYKGTATGNVEELGLAAQYANDVLSTPGYTFANLPTAYDVLFPMNLSETTEEASSEPKDRSDEIIFFEASRLDSDWYPSGIYDYYDKSSFYVPEEMKVYYEEKDVRGYHTPIPPVEGEPEPRNPILLLFQGSETNYPKQITSRKYTNNTGGSYSNNMRGNNDVLYIRLAEMKLTRAEALVRTSNTVSAEAVQLLNDVHLRAFEETDRPEAYTTGSFSGVEDFLKTVLKERNRELAYENHYRWDLVRTGNLLGDKTLGAVAKNRWNAPIPAHEVRISGGQVQQNTGYAE